MNRPSDSSPSAQIRIEVVRLLERHRSMLLGYAFALTGDHHTAEDAVQETACIIAAEPSRVPDGHEAAAGWLRAVCRRKALELGRKTRRMRRQLAPELLEQLEDAFAELDDEAGDRLDRMREAMADCVGQLRGDARTVIESRYVRGSSCEQIAEQVGRTVGAVYAVLKRVRQALGRCVDKQLSREPQA